MRGLHVALMVLIAASVSACIVDDNGSVWPDIGKPSAADLAWRNSPHCLTAPLRTVRVVNSTDLLVADQKQQFAIVHMSLDCLGPVDDVTLSSAKSSLCAADDIAVSVRMGPPRYRDCQMAGKIMSCEPISKIQRPRLFSCQAQRIEPLQPKEVGYYRHVDYHGEAH